MDDPSKLCQYHGSWCPGSLCHQVISNHDIAYCQTSDIKRTLLGNEIVDRSDVIGASPIDAAPTTSLFLNDLTHHLAVVFAQSSEAMTQLQLIGQRQLQDEMSNIKVLWFGLPYIRSLMVCEMGTC